MLAVIMAGGKGTRILEETRFRPKAMVMLDRQTILEHVMDCYVRQGVKEFLVLTGFKSELLFDYFRKKEEVLSCTEEDHHLTVDLPDRRIQLLFTGEETGSAGRLKQAAAYLKEEQFFLTYCDGLCGVPMQELLEFHKKQKALVTLTAVRPAPRFGILSLDSEGKVLSMREKCREDSPLINGGFMVMERKVLECITEEMDALESDLLTSLSRNGDLAAYCYDGFWQCMDTLQEKKYLCSMLEEGNPPWIRS